MQKHPHCELEAWEQAVLVIFLSQSVTFIECLLRGWEGKKSCMTFGPGC